MSPRIARIKLSNKERANFHALLLVKFLQPLSYLLLRVSIRASHNPIFYAEIENSRLKLAVVSFASSSTEMPLIAANTAAV